LIQKVSDLWVAGSSCGTACGTSATFNPSSSSSFQNLSSTVNIQYGAGYAEGYIGQDTVQMAGFSVSNQGFGQNLLSLTDLQDISLRELQLLRMRYRKVF
jgi:cathepsin D